jgi:hypothetical protein
MFNKKSKMIIGCLAFLLALSVGYALFSDSIKVTGKATAKASLDVTATCTKGFNSELTGSNIQGEGLDIFGFNEEYGYSNETCSDSSYIGSFVAKCYKDKYELDNNILGSTKSNSMFKSNIFSSGIVKNDDDNIVTITKKEYDILQSKINQLMKLINMKK